MSSPEFSSLIFNGQSPVWAGAPNRGFVPVPNAPEQAPLDLTRK
jgi:hypothetical protein